jgi:hypothetical protein
MKSVLNSIIEECVERNIPVQISKHSSGKICHEINGFSKSGIAQIYIDKGKIICETRYDTLDEIESFHELALVAFEWYMNYRNRNPFENPEEYWAEYWVEKGLMKKETRVVYVLK